MHQINFRYLNKNLWRKLIKWKKRVVSISVKIELDKFIAAATTNTDRIWVKFFYTLQPKVKRIRRHEKHSFWFFVMNLVRCARSKAAGSHICPVQKVELNSQLSNLHAFESACKSIVPWTLDLSQLASKYDSATNCCVWRYSVLHCAFVGRKNRLCQRLQAMESSMDTIHDMWKTMWTQQWCQQRTFPPFDDSIALYRQA